MKNSFCLLLLLLASRTFAEDSSLQLASNVHAGWSLCEGCAQPESAYFDVATQTIFLSNVDGAPDAKDGKGSIQKISVSGKMLNAKFVSGLNAPKGIRAFHGKLYVADIDELVVINQNTGKIERKIAVKEAKFLNDVAVDKNGTVYISDTVGSAIFQWSPKKGVSTLASGKFLECPNGLLVDQGKLYIAAWGVAEPDFSTKVPGRLFQMDLKSQEIKIITEKPLGNLDGLEKLDADHFLVSDWTAGKVFSISLKGEVVELISGVQGAADLAWIGAKKWLVLPRMGDNLVSTFEIQ